MVPNQLRGLRALQVRIFSDDLVKHFDRNGNPESPQLGLAHEFARLLVFLRVGCFDADPVGLPEHRIRRVFGLFRVSEAPPFAGEIFDVSHTCKVVPHALFVIW